MHGSANFSVRENKLVKEINLYLARLDFATATLRHVQAQTSPVSPSTHATAVELKFKWKMSIKVRPGKDFASALIGIR